MGLTDEELHDVLARAQEIDRAARQGDEWAVELAAVIGKSPSYLSEIETGKKPGSVAVLRQIAEALGVDLENLV